MNHAYHTETKAHKTICIWRVVALSRRVPAASSSGNFESRLLNAAEVMQRLFQAAVATPSPCWVPDPSWKGRGSASTHFALTQIASQAPSHRTPSKVRKPTFPHGLPGCVGNFEKSAHRNLLCLRRWTEDQQRYIADNRSGLTGFRSHRAVHGPFPLPWIFFLQFLPGLCRGCHPTAGQHGLCQKVHAVPLTRKPLSSSSICKCTWPIEIEICGLTTSCAFFLCTNPHIIWNKKSFANLEDLLFRFLLKKWLFSLSLTGSESLVATGSHTVLHLVASRCCSYFLRCYKMVYILKLCLLRVKNN